jgi:2-amino-4-hydroxy-6-hydroxymethyldihydropteridine diphosphokinase
MMAAAAWIGIGSNLGHPERAVADAVERIAALPAIDELRRSSLYRSAAVDLVDQPDFVNAVVRAGTAAPPLELLAMLQEIEHAMGRRRTGPRFGPRVIDLDLLLYGDRTMNHERLVLPHPRMHRRRFVLEPLAELDPSLEIPGQGRVSDLLRSCLDQDVMRLEPTATGPGASYEGTH